MIIKGYSWVRKFVKKYKKKRQWTIILPILVIFRIWDAKDVSEDLMVDDGPPPPIPTEEEAMVGAEAELEPEVGVDPDPVPGEDEEPAEERLV